MPLGSAAGRNLIGAPRYQARNLRDLPLHARG